MHFLQISQIKLSIQIFHSQISPEDIQVEKSPVSAAACDGQIVLVTGGAGFLGQHIIKQLQERAEFVKEIRVLDVKQYKNKLGKFIVRY